MAVNPLNKKIYDISNEQGPFNDKVIIAHDGGITMENFIKIHIHEIDVYVDGATQLVFKIGDEIIFDRRTTGPAEFHVLDRDYYTDVMEADIKMSISNAVIVRGSLRYSTRL